MNTRDHELDSIESLEGEERGIPNLNQASGGSAAGRALFALLLVAMLAGVIGLGVWKFQRNTEKTELAATQKTLQISNAVPARTFVAPPELPTPTFEEPAVDDEDIELTETNSASPPPLPSNLEQSEGNETSRSKPALNKSSSSLMLNTAKQKQNTDSREPKPPAQTNSGAMSDLLTASVTNAQSATMMANRNFILAKGSFIDCALQTRLDTTVPGMTACVVTRNIYSDNGKVLLVERGSTVSGEYKSNMKQGQARIFILWNRIKTPNGVVVTLNSPSTDELGGAGVGGHIDNHFWQRFGGALMLSLVDDVSRELTTNNNRDGINFTSAGNASEDMAAEALKNTINIQPTLYKNQGEKVGIYIARDLDFSGVYNVAAR